MSTGPTSPVLDVEMSGRDGAEVAQWVAAHQAGTPLHHPDPPRPAGVLRRALAAGFVATSAPATVLADVIRVPRGGRYVDPDLAMQKLGVGNRSEAVRYARDHGRL